MNKNFFFGSIAVLVIAVLTAFNVNMNTQDNRLSDVSLANVEALAGEDVNAKVSCSGDGSLYCPLSNKSDYHSVLIYEVD